MNTRRKNYKRARLTFAVAEMHRRAAQTLIEKSNVDDDDVEPSLLPSAYALYALSTELYLKCLYLEDGQEPPRTHNLLKLFNGLDERLGKVIETGYEALCERSVMVQAVRYNYPNTDWSIRGVLDQAKDGFVTWRYFQEATIEDRREMISFSLFEALPAIRGIILYSYPNWERVDNVEILGATTDLPIPPS